MMYKSQVFVTICNEPKFMIVFNRKPCINFILFFALVVATDDERIAECCRGFGADVIMTSESCKNGIIIFSVAIRFIICY